MKRNFNRNELLEWLRAAANITLLTISLSNNVSSVISNVSSPSFVAKTMKEMPYAFPKGKYIVEYEDIESTDEQDKLPYTKTIFAMAFDASIVGGYKIFNLTYLLSDISEYEYVVTSTKLKEAYKLVSIFVKQPENPLELDKLLMTLNKYANIVTVGDGSNLINLANSFINGKSNI
ncbi:hypothetical protein Q4503_10945 [Colwellia sp. 6_MG-2023]|uniref:hypothetical protein n=1 Tax=Colwellia sp. 6_MG-2023 TaxID=3062676 RepID=UPI0026E1C5A2|nr:hypothetical protein [Colwellia sp. 6_MG-2023]MDO6488220.1 hypothetical protein [Colwellia sp. 6_MG-2023]